MHGSHADAETLLPVNTPPNRHGNGNAYHGTFPHTKRNPDERSDPHTCPACLFSFSRDRFGRTALFDDRRHIQSARAGPG